MLYRIDGYNGHWEPIILTIDDNGTVYENYSFGKIPSAIFTDKKYHSIEDAKKAALLSGYYKEN